MFFNPVIYLGLTGLSLALGTVALINTENWLVMLPCLVFTILFCFSLFRPVRTRVHSVSPGTESNPRPQLVKLTASRLRVISASRTPFTANQSGPQDLSRTSA